MHEYRCSACDKLLCRIAGEAVVAVKCPRCKALNTLTFNNQTILPNAKSVLNPERPERPTKGRNHEQKNIA